MDNIILRYEINYIINKIIYFVILYFINCFYKNSMEIVMIKKKGCMPCKKFEPFVKETAEKNSLGFRTIMGESMPEKLQPPYYPFFYIYKDKSVLESWGGVSEKKLLSVLKRILKNN